MISRSLVAQADRACAIRQRVIATGWSPRKFEFGTFLLGSGKARSENRQTRTHRQHLRERITFVHGRSPASFARAGRRLTSERLCGAA